MTDEDAALLTSASILPKLGGRSFRLAGGGKGKAAARAKTDSMSRGPAVFSRKGKGEGGGD